MSRVVSTHFAYPVNDCKEAWAVHTSPPIAGDMMYSRGAAFLCPLSPVKTRV